MSVAADLRGIVEDSRVLDAPAELRTYVRGLKNVAVWSYWTGRRACLRRRTKKFTCRGRWATLNP